MNMRTQTGAPALRTPLAIVELRTIEGPNLFHPRSVATLRLDLADAHGWRSDEAPQVAEHLLLALPGVASAERDFAERLARGLTVSELVLAVALALGRSAHVEPEWGAVLETNDPQVPLLVVHCPDEAGTRAVLEAAVALVDALLDMRPVSMHEGVAGARSAVARNAPGPGLQSIIDAAAERAIPCRRIEASNGLMRLGWGRHIRWIDAAHCGGTALIATQTAADKALAARLLREARVRVPRGRVVHSADAAAQALDELTAPLVLKPVSGPHRRHAALRVTTQAEAAAAYARAALIDRRVLVEEQARGRDYRLLVVGGKVAAASERIAAQVIGNGSSTIAQLIERENEKRRANHGESASPLRAIQIDEMLTAWLAGRGVWLDSVPAAAVRVPLREAASLASGGTAIDVTSVVHPDVAAMCVRAAGVIGLDVCGVDVISPDIARDGDAVVVELNAAPSLELHCRPSAGEPRPVGKAIIEMLYRGAQPRDARIPLVAIASRAEPAGLLRGALAATGRAVGMAGSRGVWIGARQVMQGSAGARAVLADPGVEVAVVELTQPAVAREGLGYDWSDVAIVDMPDKHAAGEDAPLAALVAARVRRGGTVVLNLEGAGAVRPQPPAAGVRLLCCSPGADSVPMREHLDAGGQAILIRDGWIVRAAGHEAVERLIALDALPAACTHGDAALRTTLTAVAALHAMSVDVKTLRSALSAAPTTA